MASEDKEFRLFDFNVYAEEQSDSESENSEGSRTKPSKDSSSFMIQMFGINEKGETCCVFVNGFKPYFYAKVAENWTQSHKSKFMRFVQDKLGKYYENSLIGCKLIKKKKLYGFDGGKEHKFRSADWKEKLQDDKFKKMIVEILDDELIHKFESTGSNIVPDDIDD